MSLLSTLLDWAQYTGPAWDQCEHGDMPMEVGDEDYAEPSRSNQQHIKQSIEE